MPRPAHSPFRDGFAALWHEPALVATELTWRWCFGLAAWGLVIISGLLFLDSLKISSGDKFLLSTVQPYLVLEAVRHIFRGSLSRFLWEQTVLLLGLMLVWAFAATAGRAATLCRLVAMFSADEEPQRMNWQFAPIFALNLLRAMWTLIALMAAFVSPLGSIIMADKQHAALAALFFAFGIGLSWAFGVTLNWFFGLAPLFCIRNAAGAPEALTQSTDFVSRQAGSLFGLGVVFALLRLVWAGTMCFVVFAPLGLARHLAPGWIMLLMAMVALVYFAGADLLYLARLGAYASLAQDESQPAEPEPTIEPISALPTELPPISELA